MDQEPERLPSSVEAPDKGSTNSSQALIAFDDNWLENFYKECGREVTLAYTTLNQMKNWAIVVAAAAISGLAFGTAAGKFPNVPMFTGTVIVYAFVLRFFVRAIICYVNLVRWNTLQKDCIELKLLQIPNATSAASEKGRREAKLATDIQNYYHLWLSPLSRKSQLIQNLKLGFMLLFTLVLFFLTWGFIVLRNESLVRGLGLWAVGITVLEFYDFTHDRAFDDVKSYERRIARGDTYRMFPVPESRGWYVARWFVVLALSIGVAVWSTPEQREEAMHWYFYVAYFFGGAFLVNAVPHFVNGVSGRSFPTPFVSPPGKGLSSPMVNVLWGTLNAVVGYFLVCYVGEFHIRSVPDVLVLGAGGLLIAVNLSRWFGRLYGGR